MQCDELIRSFRSGLYELLRKTGLWIYANILRNGSYEQLRARSAYLHEPPFRARSAYLHFLNAQLTSDSQI